MGKTRERRNATTLWPNISKNDPDKRLALESHNMSDQLRVIRQVGKSFVVTIPPQVLSRADLEPGSYVGFRFGAEGEVTLVGIYTREVRAAVKAARQNRPKG